MGLDRAGDPRTEDEIVAAIFAAGDGARVRRDLDRDGIASPALPAPLLFVDVLPATPDGKVELCPADLDEASTHGLYHYQPDPGSERYPLALISPAIAQQISSTFGQLRKAPVAVELSPDDAGARKILDGAQVRIWNDLGEVVCRARISPHVRRGVAVLPKGLWRHHTANGASSNALIPQGVADLGGGPVYNDARVDIAPL
jgi:anaerobic selenocysteine-containing dehydrogenase